MLQLHQCATIYTILLLQIFFQFTMNECKFYILSTSLLTKYNQQFGGSVFTNILAKWQHSIFTSLRSKYSVLRVFCLNIYQRKHLIVQITLAVLLSEGGAFQPSQSPVPPIIIPQKRFEKSIPVGLFFQGLIQHHITTRVKS